MKTSNAKPVTIALCATLTGGLALSSSAFALEPLPGGYMIGESETEGKCGEGKCGAEREGQAEGENKDTEGKCGEGKCGAEREGQAEGENKDTEGKCGEGKCGGRH